MIRTLQAWYDVLHSVYSEMIPVLNAKHFLSSLCFSSEMEIRWWLLLARP